MSYLVEPFLQHLQRQHVCPIPEGCDQGGAIWRCDVSRQLPHGTTTRTDQACWRIWRAIRTERGTLLWEVLSKKEAAKLIKKSLNDHFQRRIK